MSTLLLRRRMLALANANKSLLPSEYQRVEYIESVENSNQAKQPIIDSQIIPTINTGFSIIYSSTVARTQTQFIIGARKATGGTIFYGLNGSSSPTNGKYLADVYINGIRTLSTMVRMDGAKMQSTLTPVGDGNFKWLLKNLDTGEEETIDVSGSTFSITETLKIFGFSKNHTLDRMRYYDGYIIDNGILKFFIPCYRKSDEVIGLYDVYNNELQTTPQGEFTKGPDIL